MVFSLKVQVPGLGVFEHEKLMRKLRLAKALANYLGMEVVEEELWEGPCVKALGGKLIADRNILDEINKASPLKAVNYTCKLRAVYKDRPVYIYIHNKYFRTVYGDIVFSSSSDVFLKSIFEEKFRKELVSAITKLKKDDSLKGIKIITGVIGFSPDALEDVRERVMSYHDQMWRFINDIFRTMKLESEEVGNVFLVKFLKPYSLDYLSKKIISIEQFNSFFKSLSQKAKVKHVGGSVFLFGEQKDSFKKIYEDFRDDFINSLRSEWYDDEKISGLLRRWLGRYASLTSFPKNR